MNKKLQFLEEKNTAEKLEIFAHVIRNKKNILDLIQNCRVCITKQLEKLCEMIAEIEDKKIFVIIS